MNNRTRLYWKACPGKNTKHKSKGEALGKSVSINFLLYEGHSDIISLYMYLKNNCAATKPNLGYIYSKNSHSRPPILCRSLNHCPSLTWSVPSLRFSSPASHRPSLPAFPLPPDDLLSHLPSYSSLVLFFWSQTKTNWIWFSRDVEKLNAFGLV